MSGILGVKVNSEIEEEVAQFSFAEGGLSLKSATRAAPAMYSPLWANSLSQMNERTPLVSALIVDFALGCYNARACTCPSGIIF